MSTIVYNKDCMEGMKEYPDKYFDLAIVDPPYGAGLGDGGGGGGWFADYRDNTKNWNGGGNTYWNRFGERFDRYKQPQDQSGGSTESITVKVHRQGANTKRNGKWVRTDWNNDKKIITWDVAPKQEYFEELFRISRNQVIWGGITSIYHLQDVS